MQEQEIQNIIRLALSKYTKSTIFRNNTGQAWQGNVKRTNTGGVYIEQARPVRFGLVKGSSDLIGWTEIEITPEMIGRKIGVFTAIEVKKPSGKVSPEQIIFYNNTKKGGCITGIIKSEDEAIRLIENFKKCQ